MQDRLNALIERQCGTIPQIVEVLGDHLRQVGPGHQGDELDAALALVHQLKGSSGTAGFQQICEAASTLYDHLDQLKAGLPQPDDTAARTRELFQMLEAAAQNLTPRASSFYAPV